MNIAKWLQRNTCSLAEKHVAVTGTTGGLGRELCRYLAELGASLILLDRNPQRSEAFRQELSLQFPSCSVRCIRVDLEDMESVREALDQLCGEPIDVLIHNAGAYSIPRHLCSSGWENIFQINFVSPYFLIKGLMPSLERRGGKVVVVGSIAHNYSKADREDIDFRHRSRASKAYGNAKRYLMFSLYELFKSQERVSLSVTHPGIAFTNITSHYPRVIFALIKHPMKIIFMKPKKACLSILKGVFDSCSDCEWIGPSLFDIWGFPKKRLLRTASAEERKRIGECAERIYTELAP